ncbi:response regulator transcription factor [Prevotella sp. kh1p2]|uniref:response regulator transcription factor n=1 Tax=Prevotella sp. kh1p2 TaxID=1761883 RepID=UPI0008AC41DC|nr:response regulator transcription factor [Prevotella sp. kh1p2]SES64485.1 DNA-binding response regulator, OmpR family, contains REC and winged-helix (wHTH) domain [Prevotella sp. kh1p2]SNU10074.1 DNA-binding response regulator, OmpR family, contains REC and winged-helix (wHTH) domain [Prevotellaceae bacterium KH2P17]
MTEDKIQVLLVEDEQTLAMIIKDTLDAQGFSITIAPNGEAGLDEFSRRKPDVVVADVMMPRMDGFEMVRRMRQHDRLTPVLFLTARSAVNDVVQGFEAGANDYLRKPFGMQELIVRLRALTGRMKDNEQQRQPARPAAGWVPIGDYLFNATTQQLQLSGITEQLSYRESEILRRLADNNCRVVNTRDILLELWGDDSFFNSRSLQVFITKLRHKLARDPQVRIVNVRGIGYKLVDGSPGRLT